MGQSITITSSGQITLPKLFREQLHVKTGDLVNAELDGDRVIITRRLSGEEIADRIEQMKGPDFYESTQALRGKTIDEIRDSKEVSDYYKEKYNV